MPRTPRTQSQRSKKNSKKAAGAKPAAQTFDLSSKPGFLLRRLDTRATLLYQKHTGQSDITPRQFGVLLTLLQRGRMTQADLSKALATDKSTLGEMLQRMVERGQLNREIPKKDRRTAALWLTEVGRQLALSLVEPAEAAQQELIAPLPEEYRSLFLKCLRLLADASNDGP
jgi:MarR family transcriptional regulator, lower aerobic nicotinate degradation pathway regulator